ncbi:MAG: type II toxin-antitoxin system RelE/ParE family toxin [Dehalococcoidia bacterium]|nr:type II toxin-antitoxin system RelE/ParE family toxin [Dehalococcoidia bacterium]
MAEYRVLIKPSAVKELEAIPKRDRQRVAAKIRFLSQSPRPPGCQKLSGQERYRIRQGSYRVVYSVSDRDEVVRVVKIGHRRDVYK